MGNYITKRNDEKERYELWIGSAVAIAEYEIEGDVVHLLHVNVPEEFRGKDVASKLTVYLLSDIKERGMRINPVCPFVKRYIERKPEWKALVNVK